MTGLEPLVVGYLMAWTARKARRVGEQIDHKVDEAIDASIDRLGDLVLGKLGSDPALEQLRREAAGGVGNERTRLRVELALEDALEQDTGFAKQLRLLVQEIQTATTLADARVVINARAEGQANMPVLGSGTQYNTFGGSAGSHGHGR